LATFARFYFQWLSPPSSGGGLLASLLQINTIITGNLLGVPLHSWRSVVFPMPAATSTVWGRCGWCFRSSSRLQNMVARRPHLHLDRRHAILPRAITHAIYLRIAIGDSRVVEDDVLVVALTADIFQTLGFSREMGGRGVEGAVGGVVWVPAVHRIDMARGLLWLGKTTAITKKLHKPLASAYN